MTDVSLVVLMLLATTDVLVVLIGKLDEEDVVPQLASKNIEVNNAINQILFNFMFVEPFILQKYFTSTFSNLLLLRSNKNMRLYSLGVC